VCGARPRNRRGGAGEARRGGGPHGFPTVSGKGPLPKRGTVNFYCIRMYALPFAPPVTLWTSLAEASSGEPTMKSTVSASRWPSTAFPQRSTIRTIISVVSQQSLPANTRRLRSGMGPRDRSAAQTSFSAPSPSRCPHARQSL